ncbi:MAG: FAD-dependent oxidoreductase [Verrucomicrobiota bacterium]|jgi:glutamate synthase (NADPH/NADH) small chain
MNAEATDRSGGKHAWRELDRIEPPKRPARDRLSDFNEVSQPYDETTASQQASRCVQCPNPNCIAACPLNIPVPELLSLTADRRFREAAQLLFNTQSLPEFVTHICVENRMCEAACVLQKPSSPVPIGSISRFLLDYGWKHGVQEPPAAPANGRRVTIVGSGLCGLVAADALARLGYAVTIMDSAHAPGGRLVNGLAGFKVDRAVIRRRVQSLKQRGVHFRMGILCGRDVTMHELRRENDALLFALGRTDAVPLEIPGANLRGVCQAYPFILHHTSDAILRAPPVNVEGLRVVVLGAGDTAMDALRVALRSGASDALCLYRRDHELMPADPKEFENAAEEGARFQFRCQAVEILGNLSEEVIRVRCMRTELEPPDGAGRINARPRHGTEFEIPAEVVLVAYGFKPPRLPDCREFKELAVDALGCLAVDSAQMTNLPGVFAAGSIAHWPVSMVAVMQDARNAAAGIDRYLSTRPTRD